MVAKYFIINLEIFKSFQSKLGSTQIASIRAINGDKISVKWIEPNGDIIGKDVSKNDIKLFECFSIMGNMMNRLSNISLRLFFIILLISLSINGIYSSYSIIKS